MVFDPASIATSLTINQEALPIKAALPQVVRDLSQASTPNSPNQLSNFGFEDGDRGWKPLMHNKVDIEVVSYTAQKGTNALAIRSHDQDGIAAPLRMLPRLVAT